MTKKVAIIDYGINNISSFEKAFSKINIQTEVVTNSEDLKKFSHLVLPGVGSFDWGVKNLKKQGLFEEIKSLSKKGHNILGICLGMQLLFQKSEESENNITGLSLLEGRSRKLKKAEKKFIKIPHVGWNSLNIKKKEKILEYIENDSNFYFIHSYYVEPEDPEIITATCNHGIEFPSVIEDNNIIGIQFHPEKCQVNGLKILEKFLNLKN